MDARERGSHLDSSVSRLELVSDLYEYGVCKMLGIY